MGSKVEVCLNSAQKHLSGLKMFVGSNIAQDN